jgi:hypothetical protein
MGTLALLEVLDRDGHVRHSVGVRHWPLRAGRALDNELVLDDPHVAAHHLSVAADDEGQVFITVGDTRNGAEVGHQRLAAASRVPVGDAPVAITLGRTTLRLRLARHPLPPEQPLAAVRPLWHELATLAGLLGVVLALLGFDTYLSSEPASLVRQWASLAMGAVAIGLAWPGVMSLFSKVFTRQAHFLWHLRVMLWAVIAWWVVDAAASALAFMLSWPALSSFSFVAVFAVVGAALTHHMLAIEPRHPGRWRTVGALAALIGIGITLWQNHQSHGRLGNDLYLTHLLPPALRLVPAVDSGDLVNRLEGLKAGLDAKAQTDDDEPEASAEEPAE